MKTSNKLLLGFLAVVILTLVSFDFIVVSESSKFKPETKHEEKFIKLNDKPFKHIKINAKQSGWVSVSIQHESNYELKISDKNLDSVKFEILHDTLTLTINGYSKDIQISSPFLRSIISKGTASVNITGFSMDTLSVFTSARSSAGLEDNTLKYLEIAAQDSSEISLNDNNKIDDMLVKLKKGSHLSKP